MVEVIAQRAVSLTATKRSLFTLPVRCDPETARFTLRIPYAPGWTGALEVALVAEVDGVEQARATFTASGTNRTNKDGTARAEFVATWEPPSGWWDDDDGPARRLGETGSSFGVRVEFERARGTSATAFSLDCDIEPAPQPKRHHSIAYQNATAAWEDGGDGVVSVSFDAGAGTDRAALVVGGSDRTGQVTTHTVTYGGAAPSITRPWNVTDGSFSRCTGDVFIDSEIGSGAKTVQLSCSETTDGGSAIAVVTMTGVHQTVPAGTAVTTSANAGSGATATVTVGSINATDLVVDGLLAWDTAVTIGADQTQRASAVSNGLIKMSTQAGTAGGVMSWTGVDNEYSYGAVAFKEVAGGATTNQSVSVTSTTTAAMRRSIGKPLAVTASLTATMIRSIGKPLAATVTTSTTLIRSVGKVLSVTSATTATMARVVAYLRTLAVTSTTTATISRAVSKILSVTSTTTAALAASRAFLRTLAATATTTATMVRSVGKVLSVTSTTAATMSRTVAYLRTIAATVTGNPTIVRQVSKTLSATITVTGTLFKSISKTLSAISSIAASLVATFQGASGPADIGTADLANEATATATLDDALVNSATMTHTALGSATLDVVLVNP